jgi:hypothetical protein
VCLGVKPKLFHGTGYFMILAGWIMTGFLALFMAGASAMPKFLGLEAAVNSMKELGWSPNFLLMFGLLELGFTILFLIPRTSLFGAILLTGLFGGAIASHLRVGNPLFSHTLFPVYLGIFMWLSLGLRDVGLRTFLFSFFQSKP